MNILTRIYAVWILLMMLYPGGSLELSGPSEVRGPVGGSLSLQCQYEERDKTNKKYWCKRKTSDSCEGLIETESNHTTMKDRLSIRDNSTALTFTVTMEQLTEADSGTYWCRIYKSNRDLRHSVQVIVPDSQGKIGPREEQGFVGGSFSLLCKYDKYYKDNNKYWCRGEKWSSCKILADTESKRNDRISITDNKKELTFTVDMEHLTETDSGKYWCGIKRPGWDSGYAVTVTVLSDSRGMFSPREEEEIVGGSLSVQCQYEEGYKDKNKYWCKGETWSSCKILADTESKRNDRISITDNKKELTFTVDMEHLTLTDSGKYWCGIKRPGWDYGYAVTVTVLSELRGPSEVRGSVGGSLSLQCQYKEGYKTNWKYWCRGEIWNDCKKLIKTESNSIKTKDRLSIRDNSTALTFTVTMEQLTETDSGTYWCGVDKSASSDPWHSVIVTVLPGSSTLTPDVTSTTATKSSDTGTKSDYVGTTVIIPSSTNSTRAFPVHISYILMSAALVLLLLFALVIVLLIRRRRRKKALKEKMSNGNMENAFHHLTLNDVAESALYSVPRKPPPPESLYSNVASLPGPEKQESCYEEVQSQCMIMSPETEDVHYSNVRFSVNPNLENTANTRPPYEKSSTEVTYAVINAH